MGQFEIGRFLLGVVFVREGVVFCPRGVVIFCPRGCYVCSR